MKKILTIAIALIACLALSAPAMACWGPSCNDAYVDGFTDIGGSKYREADNGNASAGAGFNSYNTYEADHSHRDAFAHGESNATGTRDAKAFSLQGPNAGIAGAGAGATVNSDAFALTGPGGSGCKEYDRSVMVSGYVSQGNGADAFGGNLGTWASGGNNSEAGYYGSNSESDFDLQILWWNLGGFDDYDLSTQANGYATTGGGTLVGAATLTGKKYEASFSGAITGNSASAYQSERNGNAYVSGSGGVQSATFAQKVYQNRGASAGSYGSASFSYSDSGRNHASGSGSAGTFGHSAVAKTKNGMTAHSQQTSFATSTGGGGQPD